MIPTVISQIAARCNAGQPGWIKLGATRPTRDFTFVGDTVAGFRAAARCDDALGEVINIGTNFEISIGDTAELIAEIMGVALEIETTDERLRPDASEVERLWCDNSKAADLLSWAPSYSGRDGFRRGLCETVEWFTRGDNHATYKADIYNV